MSPEFTPKKVRPCYQEFKPSQNRKIHIQTDRLRAIKLFFMQSYSYREKYLPCRLYADIKTIVILR
ncbi:MAG: hypothetical protein CSA33_09170 [Desulfobulbus propionicus]|nr:MAG: hypothetical protein CSA33_09170 [Desulfobulbus propionicus]